MRRHSISIASALVLLAISALATAHHGWRGYTETLEMSVTVTELALRNPHDRLIVVDTDGDEWNLLLAPPARNRRFGFSEDSVSVGDELTLFGQKHPSRNEVKVHCLYREDELIYTYRYDNGRTSLSRSRRTSRDDC